MATEPMPKKSAPKWMFWVGLVLSLLVGAALIFSASMKLTHHEAALKSMSKEELDWPVDLLVQIGVVELVCVVIYLIPQTSILGAILLTGYLGGAVAAHVRVHDNFPGPIIMGVVVWGALWLRCGRLRAILPLRL